MIGRDAALDTAPPSAGEGSSRPVSAAQLLDAWEAGRTAQAGERALLLLYAARPESPRHELASLSIGCRDAALLQMRASTFGERLTALAACPDCGEQLEMEFSVGDVLLTGYEAVAETPAEATAPVSLAPVSLEIDGYRLMLRVPNGLDAAALGRDAAGRDPERHLFERCLLAAYRGDEPVAAADLPQVVMDAAGERLAKADPQADIELSLVCPACGAAWESLFDIVSFFWREIEAWAARVLGEVHWLASAYGWSERDILALSPWRRQYYLELIGR